MPPLLRFSVLPAIGVLFLAAAYLWCQRELNLRLFGQAAEGRLIGMVLQRGDHADVVAHIETNIVLTLANGDRIDCNYTDYAFARASYRAADDASPTRSLSAGDVDALVPSDGGLKPELRRVLGDTLRSDADNARWALLRESRRPEDPLRVIRIEKTETIQGYFGVPRVPDVFGLEDGRLVLNENGSASPFFGTARIRAVFDRSDEASVKAQKGETLTDYSYERMGKPYAPEKKDFVLQAEPYSTQFRPIFAFTANGRAVARLSHIGRRGGPTLALRLYEPCRVYYDSKQPEQAVVTAIPGPVAGAPLAWFSRVCEGLFGQWGSAALIALAGLLFIGTGLLFLILAFIPSENPPSPSAAP